MAKTKGRQDDRSLYALQERLHRTETTLLRLARVLERHGLISVVKLFRRPGPSPELLERAARTILSPAPSKLPWLSREALAAANRAIKKTTTKALKRHFSRRRSSR